MVQFKISTDPDQQFSLIMAGHRVTIRLRYNKTVDRWSFDLSIDDLPVLTGRRIVVGVDLLAAYPSLGIGMLIAIDDVEGSQPNRDDLPNGKVRLYSLTEAEFDAAIS